MSNVDHRVWVGDMKRWDLLGAHQFNVMTSLGLGGDHKLLDIGCGSLRGGRLFIVYLEPGNYYGIEPAKDVLQHAIEREMGQEIIAKRQPSFDHSRDADLAVFGDVVFDFVLAHSVLVHAPGVWIETCFRRAKEVLKPRGKFAASIIFAKEDSGETNWDYPRARFHTKKTIGALAKKAGLVLDITSIKHPVKDYTWIVLKHA